MGGVDLTDVRRERIPLLRNTVKETALAKGLFQQREYEVSVCLQKNEAVWKGCTQ